MTRISLSLVFALATLFANASFGQSQPRMTSEKFYKSSAEARMYHQQFRHTSAGRRILASQATATSAGPGDNFIGFLYVGDQNFGFGDVVRPRLLVANSTDQYGSKGVEIYGRLFIPGPSGQFDDQGSMVYITPDNGSYGYYRGGFAGIESIPLYSLPITTQMNSGEYLFDFSIVDAASGGLIQQVFARFFVNHTSVSGKGLYTLDGVASIRQMGPSASSVTLQGNFPASSSVYVLSGTPQYAWGFGPYMVDPSGHLITIATAPIAGPGYAGAQQSSDVIVHFPQIRESVSLHNAFAVQITINNLPIPQQ